MTDRRSDPHPDSPPPGDNRNQEHVDPDTGVDGRSDVEGQTISGQEDAPNPDRDPNRPRQPWIRPTPSSAGR